MKKKQKRKSKYINKKTKNNNKNTIKIVNSNKKEISDDNNNIMITNCSDDKSAFKGNCFSCMQFVKKVINSDVIFYFLMFLSFVLTIVFSCVQMYNGAILSIFIFWIYCVLYTLCDMKNNFLLLIMLIFYFTFVISRPIISFFEGNNWWYFKDVSVFKALVAISLSLCCIMLGKKLYSHFIQLKNESDKPIIKAFNRFFSYRIIKIIFVIMLICSAFNIYVELYNYIMLNDLDYAKVYTSMATTHHIIIRIFSSLYFYVTILYLSTIPKKKYVYITLGIFIVTAIPSFLLGSRNALAMRIVFAIVYMFVSDIFNYHNEIYFTKKIKRLILIFIPAFVIFMGAYNYIRDNKDIETGSIFGLIADTFYKQGTTFDTICQGFEFENELLNSRKISYTFGDIIDYLGHNTLSQRIFNASAFPAGNSLIMVNESNSVAHKLSYYVLGEDSYLDGHGRGTSFIIETYLDGGYFWMSVYSLIIGFYLSSVIDLIKKNKMLISYLVFVSIYKIFLLPRFSASDFISFIVKPYFWFTLLLFCGMDLLLKKAVKGQ